jgi:hypothetical protein
VDLNTLYQRSLTQYLEHSQCYSLQRHVLLCRTRWQHDLFINAPEAGCAAHLVAMLHLGLLFCWLCGGCKCHHGNVTVVQSTLHHHHQITKLSHSINTIGPAPHRSGRKREHRSIVFATITHIPSLHKIRRNAPRYHPTNPLATPNIIRNKTHQRYMLYPLL